MQITGGARYENFKIVVVPFNDDASHKCARMIPERSLNCLVFIRCGAPARADAGSYNRINVSLSTGGHWWAVAAALIAYWEYSY